jgi:hypothetical protein
MTPKERMMQRKEDKAREEQERLTNAVKKNSGTLSE